MKKNLSKTILSLLAVLTMSIHLVSCPSGKTNDNKTTTVTPVATLASTTILQDATDIVVNFTQAVAKGTGDIVLTPPVAEGEMAMPVNIPLTTVTIGGTGDDENKVVTVTIPPTSRPLKIGSYTLSWVAGVFQTVAVAPATATDIAALLLTFSVEDTTPPTLEDTTPPTLISSNVDGSKPITPSGNIILTMSEVVTLSTTPKTGIVLYRAPEDDNGIIGLLSTSGNTITINPLSTLAETTTGILTIPAGCFQDAAGNLSGLITLRFVVARDRTAPTLISSVPPQNGEISVGDNIVLTMSEAVRINMRGSENFRTFSISSSIGLTFPGPGIDDVNIDSLATAQIRANGATVTINPPENLTVGELWTLTIPRGYISDGADNPAEMILLTFDVVN